MIELVEPDLGSLRLRGKDDPFVVVSYEISARATRAVMRNRALSDGGYDDTRYVGGRVMTISIRLKDGLCDSTPMQSLYDMILPFTAQRRRPVVRWSLPGSDGDVRQMNCRGDGAPIVIEGPHFPALVATFVSAEGEITSATGGENGDGLHCQIIDPSGDTEEGREYDLEFDRVYPPSAGIGDRTITTMGNDDAHWTATIFGSTEDPFIRINGITVQFTGLTIPGGQSLIIDTREQTMLLNGDPSQPRYNLSNYSEWQWADLLLKPGDNQIRFGAETLGTGAQVQFCWRDTWLG